MGKMILFIFILVSILSCNDSEIIKSISDEEGVIFEINIKNPSALDNHPWVGMKGYYPDKRVAFAGQDSIGIEHFYPDGEYQIDSKNYDLISSETAYEFKVIGMSTMKTYQFNLTFDSSDTLNTIKKSVSVVKNRNTYIIKEIR